MDLYHDISGVGSAGLGQLFGSSKLPSPTNPGEYFNIAELYLYYYFKSILRLEE